MPMNIEDPEARVFEFMHNIFLRLEGVGYGDFKKENPKVMISLIQETLYPHTLKAEMGKHLRFKPGLKTDLKAFIKLCCTEAKSVDRYSAKPKRSNEAKAATSVTPRSLQARVVDQIRLGALQHLPGSLHSVLTQFTNGQERDAS